MTSTATFQGMDSESKPSSRVLAPPGGGSSNIFGSAEPTPAPPKKESAPPKPVEPAPVAQPNQGERFVRAAPKQAYNPITGQPYDTHETKKKESAATKEDEEEKEEGKENEKKHEASAQPAVVSAAKEKTSTRIAQPPGGKSSGLW